MKPLQPLRIADVGLATGRMFGVTGIDQKHLDSALLKQFENRNPVNAGRFHRHCPDAAFREPVGQP